MGCLDQGEWLDLIRGAAPAGRGADLLLHRRDCPACAGRLTAALRLSRAMRGAVDETVPDEPHTTDVDLAAALADDRVPAHVWSCAECLRLAEHSLVAIRADFGEFRAGELTRRRVRRAAEMSPAPGRRAAWRPVIGLLAAAAVLAIVWFSPAPDPWARRIGLSRGQTWTLPRDLAGDLARGIEEGRLTPGLFDLPAAGREVERDLVSGPSPVTRTPRFEAVLDGRPSFVWDGSGFESYEIFVLDSDRQLLWSRESSRDSLAYPVDEAPLAPGKTYFWKVNGMLRGRLVASAYAGVSVAATDDAERCRRRIARYSSHPFLAGTVYDRCGMYSAAAAAFEEAAGRMADPGPAERLVREVRSKQGLTG